MGTFTTGTLTGDILTQGPQKTQIIDMNGNVVDAQQVEGLDSVFGLGTYVLKPTAKHFSAPVFIRQSAATTAGNTVWALRMDPSSTKLIYIDEIDLTLSFDSANPATRTTLFYNLCKLQDATPSGGILLNDVKMDTSNAAADTIIRQLDTGLTTTGVTFGAAMTTFGVPAVSGAVARYQRRETAIKIEPGQGLCIRLNTDAVVGLGINGTICFSQR